MAKTASALKVKQADAVKMFVALGFKTVDKWPPDRMVEKLSKLHTSVDDAALAEIKDKEVKKLVKEVCAAGEGKVDIVLDTGEKGAKAEKKGDKKAAAAPAKKGGKKAAVEEDDDDADGDDDADDDDDDTSDDDDDADDDDDDAEASAKDDDDDDDTGDDDDDEDEEPAPKKKGKKEEKPAKKSEKGEKKKDGPVKKVGIIATIVSLLQGASKAKPITKEKIVAKLKKKFPDREERAMKSTVNSQVPSGLKAEKSLVVKTDGEGGFWLPE